MIPDYFALINFWLTTHLVVRKDLYQTKQLSHIYTQPAKPIAANPSPAKISPVA